MVIGDEEWKSRSKEPERLSKLEQKIHLRMSLTAAPKENISSEILNNKRPGKL